MQTADLGNNYKFLDHECKRAFTLFFNEFAVYLKPVASMKATAVAKCDQLWNFYRSNIIQDICKKYPSATNLECDPALIDLKYVETMVEHSRHKLEDMHMYTEQEVSRALANDKAREIGSRIEQARSLSYLSGIQIDMPTDSSVYKNLPPYICAMSSYTGGNNPALPLYQYSMGEGAQLDNPFNVLIPPEMELCHTEGRLFYTGYDGFLEEYAPLTFDPHITDSTGAVIDTEKIIDSAMLQNSGESAPAPNVKQDNMPIVPQLSLMDQLQFEKARAAHLRQYNETYYSGLFNNVVDDPLLKSAVGYMYGHKGLSALEGAKALVNIGETVKYTSFYKSIMEKLDDLNNLFDGFSEEENEKEGKGMRDGNMISTHNMFVDKVKHMRRNLEQKANKYAMQTDSKQLIHPLLKACGILRMRKNIQDVNDHSVMRHSIKKNRETIDNQTPACGRCGGREQLKIHRHSNEIACQGCYSGKGLTMTRKIMNASNTDDLATSSNPNHAKMSGLYNAYIMRDKKEEQANDTVDVQPANPHWQKLVESAKPYFRNHPLAHLKQFTHHRQTEPLPDNYKHTLKNVALMGGRLHSMLEIEKKHMVPEHLQNLKHNFAWYAAHLPKGKGKLKSHNLVGAGDQFEDIAQNINDATEHAQHLASVSI
jgi:hypothetical protein